MASAVLMLRNAGFERYSYRFTETYAQDYAVVHQSPAAGSLMDIETEVALDVAQTNWVNFLPTAFRQSDLESPAFLRNFLFIFQHLHAQMEIQIQDLHKIFDPLETDPEFIPWLAGWVGLVMAPEWDEDTRRRWVRDAPRLYARRGTRDALLELIQVFTGLEANIEENRWPYPGFRIGVCGMIGIDSIVTPTIAREHAFIVHIPVRYEEITTQKLLRLHQVIQMEKPAHTIYFVQFQKDEYYERQRAFLAVGEQAIGVEADSANTPNSDNIDSNNAGGQTQ